MLKSKIHRARVTQCDLHYVGSLTVDSELMAAADLLPGELVHVVDINSGSRLETYVIPGDWGSGVIGVNGAAARLVACGDLIIIISYAGVRDDECAKFEPQVVFVDYDNRIAGFGNDPADTHGNEGLARGDDTD